ncbi:hypothetical protein P175DRAFT_0166395 [Aspergillus ochraceoroseus IBT 24754]|uniref:Uncharacterized protein n=1 Tax=Aspergillus ochraceoroseus IBT 24754 TaxID=1392256 RepID=A0A2T5M466_9EURO|nr:uncharacterized protein P175DRAFT_0166395 [Aspergillus ochraceoroseus IBT 24754]PTU23306.1 hypothetical protein P175DRAFT_0166395 [Aspergillus ochraceoroseus IBT 24754]
MTNTLLKEFFILFPPPVPFFNPNIFFSAVVLLIMILVWPGVHYRRFGEDYNRHDGVERACLYTHTHTYIYI